MIYIIEPLPDATRLLMFTFSQLKSLDKVVRFLCVDFNRSITTRSITIVIILNVIKYSQHICFLFFDVRLGCYMFVHVCGCFTAQVGGSNFNLDVWTPTCTVWSYAALKSPNKGETWNCLIYVQCKADQ